MNVMTTYLEAVEMVKIRNWLLASYPSCQVCYDRVWSPVSAETFIRCYASRIAAGMPVNLEEKLRECSMLATWCTCPREE